MVCIISKEENTPNFLVLVYKFRGNAYKTTGGLTSSNLIMNKHGRVVSAIKHKTAKKERRLQNAGYLTKKGQFGFIKAGGKTQRNRN